MWALLALAIVATEPSITGELLQPRTGFIMRGPMLRGEIMLSPVGASGCACVAWHVGIEGELVAQDAGCRTAQAGVPVGLLTDLGPIPPGIHWIRAYPSLHVGRRCTDPDTASAPMVEGSVVPGLVERQSEYAADRVTLLETRTPRTARFVPRGEAQRMSSIFTIWNVLDALMEEADPHNVVRVKYGYVKTTLVAEMLKIIDERGFTTVCEVGFNGGHSAAAFLAAREETVVHSFDLGVYPYSNTTSALLGAIYNRTTPRFFVHWGNSEATVPAFAASLAVRGASVRPCELILIDGGHSAAAVDADIRNFRRLAAERHALVFDDTPAETQWYSEAGNAVRAAKERGALRIVEAHRYGVDDTLENPPLRFPLFDDYAGGGLRADPWGYTRAQYAAQP